ncbi:MAG: hypothetical protein B7X69_09350 [Sulfurovum sp. 39-42-12]|nr:MAG: hypothetical protein B7Y23_02785 [Sulfurovum sp. 16-42-52]OZA46170.1 MAG: hypothetical protein B7X80_03215 [Sulfurovum sp. 17-42-90]OZA59122.1 MAG: hypothetical protein B7X69_09350 [Sulfurovum sp. 39-42-12]HQR74231.1 hypothetical protein [Sulfurovum sp.]
MRKLTDDELILLGTGAYTLRHFTLDEMEDYISGSVSFETEMGENNYANKQFSQWNKSGQEALNIVYKYPCTAFAFSLLIHRHVGVPKQLWAYESMGYNCEVFTDYMLTFLEVIGKSHSYGKYIWVKSVEYFIANGYDAPKLRVFLEDIKDINFTKLIGLKKEELRILLKEMKSGKYPELASGIALGIDSIIFSKEAFNFPNNEDTYDMLEVLIGKAREGLNTARGA